MRFQVEEAATGWRVIDTELGVSVNGIHSSRAAAEAAAAFDEAMYGDDAHIGVDFGPELRRELREEIADEEYRTQNDDRIWHD